MYKVLCLAVASCLILAPTASTSAQNVTTIECGSTVEGEFTLGNTEHRYGLELEPGDNLTIASELLGDGWELVIRVFDPAERMVGVEHNARTDVFSMTVGGRGVYEIRPSSNVGKLGVYTLYVSCALRDGTVIEADGTVLEGGDNSTSANSGANANLPLPQNLDAATKLPLLAGTPLTGIVTQNETYGFTLDVSAGETYTFDFAKISGNLNLGIAILSADNQIVFYGGMIASNRLSTDVTFPSSGQYTVGVFRVDLLPPDVPEATAFQVTATLQ